MAGGLSRYAERLPRSNCVALLFSVDSNNSGLRKSAFLHEIRSGDQLIAGAVVGTGRCCAPSPQRHRSHEVQRMHHGALSGSESRCDRHQDDVHANIAFPR